MLGVSLRGHSASATEAASWLGALLNMWRCGQVNKVNLFTISGVDKAKKRLKGLQERVRANKEGRNTDALLKVSCLCPLVPGHPQLLPETERWLNLRVWQAGGKGDWR